MIDLDFRIEFENLIDAVTGKKIIANENWYNADRVLHRGRRDGEIIMYSFPHGPELRRTTMLEF